MARKKESKVKDFIPESSRIEPPSKLSLMPGERLLGSHYVFYLTNKRIIEHNEGIFGHNTTDYSFKHIKGLNEVNRRPFLKGGLVFGILSLIAGIFFSLFFVVGAIFIVLALWYKISELEVNHMDGDKITIPKIKEPSAQNLIKLLRTQIYDKNP